MYLSDSHIFKNEATRRFHDYLYAFVKTGGNEKKKVFDAFGLNNSANPSSFFAQMRTGKKGVTLDQIYTAKEKLQLNPAYLFEVSDQATLGFSVNVLSEPLPDYSTTNADKTVLKQTGEKLHNIFKKHGTEIKNYAEKQLGITRVALHKIFRGESRCYFDLVLKVAEDHGESLEQFRTKPLPKGHHLTQMELQVQIIEQQNKRIANMEDKIKELEARTGK